MSIKDINKLKKSRSSGRGPNKNRSVVRENGHGLNLPPRDPMPVFSLYNHIMNGHPADRQAIIDARTRGTPGA